MRFVHGLTAAALAACTTLASASVFYKFDIVAQTGTGGIASLGTGPAVNEKGKVSYIGRTTTSTTASASVYVWSPTGGSVDIATNFFSPNRNFGETVRMNKHDEVATWNRLLPLGLSEVRIFRPATPNDSTVLVRGLTGGGQAYELLYQHPALNATKSLEDRNSAIATGNKDGFCDAGEVCMSEVAFTSFNSVTERFIGTVIENPSQASDPGLFFDFGFSGQVAKPSMADDGSIVVRAALASDPLVLFDYNLGAPTQIAGAAQAFTALGNAPGITHDAKIIAFAGNRGQGDGIFLSQKLPSGQRRIVRIAGENLTVQKAELGFSATNSKLYFSSVELDSRVGIAYTPGRNGAPDGAVVVTFIATPNAASRTNTGTGKPYLFSAQKGLWALRVELAAPLYEDVCNVRAPGVTGNPFTPGGDDQVQVANGVPFVNSGANKICESGNAHNVETLFARAGPIPVVQVGDRILAHTVANIGVHDPVAPANFDDAGATRGSRLGDHRVAFWADVGGGNQLIVRGEHLDSDQDGLMDHWETIGLDLDGTGSVDLNLAQMGANPLVRDFFVQIDFAADRPPPLNLGEKHRPIPGVMRQLAQFYAGAPAMPSGVPAGIHLHVDAGTGMDRAGQPTSRNMGTGALFGGSLVSPQPVDIIHYGLPGSVALAGVNALDFDTVKQNTLRIPQRGAREFVFTHVIWADFHHGLGANGGSNNVSPVTGAATLGGDLWYLYDNANPNLQAGKFGHGILITGGTGAGQIRQIASTGANFVGVSDPWNVVPDTTSTYILLHGSGGESQPGYRVDGAFGPGKNFSLTLGGFNRDPVGNEQGTFRTQWKTLAHEIGHNQTLMHGGSNHNNYKANYVSLMNYAYELCTSGVGKGPGGTVLPGAAPCPVNSYSGPTDAVRDDWGTLDFASALNPTRTGQAFSVAIDPATLPFPPPDERRILHEILIQEGPSDTTAPVATLTSPPSGTTIALGNGIAVAFTATDNVGVTRAEVLFDVNGNGEIDEPAEVFAATPGSGNSFSANVPAASGPSGTRSLTVYAFDAAGNPGTAYVRINVGGVANLTVPNVVGSTEQAAINALLAAQFEPGAITRSQSGAVPAGKVISQNPAAGQSRAPGTAVALVISLGSNGVTVPNVKGMTQSAAGAAIAAAGLSVGAVTQVANTPLPPNTVIGQSPLGGAIAVTGSAVQLLVAAGAGVSVPNVVGLTQAAATSAINGAGLVVGTVTQQSHTTVPAGNVISQNPVGGTVVAGGSAVDLVVSTGPSNVTVPNVVGQTQAAATTAINNAGLVVGAITQQTSLTVPAGSVISQNPAAGASVPSGSAVALVVSLGPSCAGFNDVLASSSFCPNLQWLVNRNVTSGCATGLYCPNNVVIRLAMARFQNNEGVALTPIDLDVVEEDSAPNLATPQLLCATPAPGFAVTGYPRRAYLRGKANLYSPTASGDFSIEHVFSTNGGATWQPVPGSMVFRSLTGGLVPDDDQTVTAYGVLDLNINTTYHFAHRAVRIGGTGNVGYYCTQSVQIGNRNGSSAPF